MHLSKYVSFLQNKINNPELCYFYILFKVMDEYTKKSNNLILVKSPKAKIGQIYLIFVADLLTP